MEDVKMYREYGAELERRLRLKTFPVAIKLLEKEKDIPEGAKRPLKDFGHHFSLCQTLAMSRREGKVMAMLKEDHWCFEPVVGYGLGEPPEYFLQGHNRYPKDVATLEAGKHYAEEFPRLESGKYIGMASAALPIDQFSARRGDDLLRRGSALPPPAGAGSIRMGVI